MSAALTTLQRAAPAVWLGLLLCIAGITAPSAFAALPQADAGRMLARVFAIEAACSLGFGLVLTLLSRRAVRSAAGRGGSQFSANLMLALLTLFCTVFGYYALQPMMGPAREGHGPLSFGQLHAVSLAFFVVKALCVAALAWRAAGEPVRQAIREPAPVSPSAAS